MTMAKKRKVNRRTPQKKQQEGAIMPFITGLCVGLFIAFVVYLKGSHTTTNNEVAEAIDIPAGETPTLNQVKAKADKLEFDFYDILPEREVRVPEWEPPKAKTLNGVEVNTGSYVFQVGSFQKNSDADSVKAKLAMLGFPVQIQRVVINGQKIWFRVRVGPYKDSSKLNSVRKRLSANNMDYILLRIKDDA